MVWLSISIHQSGHSRTQIMHEVQALASSAIAPSARGGIALTSPHPATPEALPVESRLDAIDDQ